MNVKKIVRLKQFRKSTLQCSLCIFLEDFYSDGIAITIINGQAVCADHINTVEGGEHVRYLQKAMGLK